MKWIIIRIKLFIIRKIRLVKIMCPKSDVLLYVLLVLLWLAFGFISKYIADIHGDPNTTYLRTVWNLRNSIFTSIVLAFSIGAFNHLHDYRSLLKRQHFLYVDAMDDFEDIYRALLNDDVWLYFHALYNEKCQEVSWDLITSKLQSVNVLNDDIVLAINTIQERLDKIDDQLKDGLLMVKDEEMLSLEISSAKKLISKIMVLDDIDAFENVEKLTNELFLILEELRFIWRRDLKLDMELLKMEKNPQEDFYQRMWLPDFDIIMLRNW